MDTLWRLVWALPLVLAIGVGVALILKRFVAPAPHASRQTQRMTMRESLSLSDEMRVHLIEVDGHPYLLVESARNAVLQSALPQASEGARSTARFGPPWMQRLYKAGSR